MGIRRNSKVCNWLSGAAKSILFVKQLAVLVRCCTIYEFNGSGFAANAFTIAHMVPVFHNTNGTFFLDNTNNHYKCSEEGGWHDFFGWEDQVSTRLAMTHVTTHQQDSHDVLRRCCKTLPFTFELNFCTFRAVTLLRYLHMPRNDRS